MKFVTVDAQSEQSRKFLTGKFSNSEKAIFVQPFTRPFSQSKKTFKIVDRSGVSLFDYAKLLFKLGRPHLLASTLAPLFSLMCHYYFLKQDVNAGDGILACLSMTFLHFGVFLLNNYFDHVRGSDPLAHQKNKNILNASKIPAFHVFYVAVILLGLSLAVATPLLYQSWQLLLSALVAVALIFGYSIVLKGLKSIGMGELAVFLGLGPLLVYGFSQLYSGETSPFVLYYGVINGFLCVLYVQHRNFNSIIADGLAGVRTFMVRLGFDRAKVFLALSFWINLALIWSINFIYLPNVKIVKLAGSLTFLLVYILLGAWYLMKIKRVQSPLSSSIASLSNTVLGLLWLNQIGFVLVSFVNFGFLNRVPFTMKIEVLSFFNQTLRFFGL